MSDIYQNKCFETEAKTPPPAIPPRSPVRGQSRLCDGKTKIFLSITTVVTFVMAGLVAYIVLTHLKPQTDETKTTPTKVFTTKSSPTTVKTPTTTPTSTKIEKVTTSAPITRDCWELFNRLANKVSGIYMIQPEGYPQPFEVYCDMENDGGGWTVFQRRIDGSITFYRGWSDYKKGFGLLNTEFWLGNDKLFYLTSQDRYDLRVFLEDFEGNTRYALYDSFRVGSEASYYKLFLGVYSGNAGDALTRHKEHFFTTMDEDHDNAQKNCAREYSGAWWYDKCHNSNLNGLYLAGEHASFANGINWKQWRGYHYSYKTTVMKIRPTLG